VRWGIVSALLQVSGYSLTDVGRFAANLPDLRLAEGQTAALYGPSGCGKTSLLFAIFGLLERNGWNCAGSVHFRGRSLAEMSRSDLLALRRHEVAFLMQDAHAALDPLVAVGEQVLAATGATPQAALEMLTRLGLEDAAALGQRQPHRISGGQAQRIQLAIALLRQPALVIVDEPSANLDGGTYADLLACLRSLVAAGSALLMATHDHRLLRDLQADVYQLEGTSFVKGRPDEESWRRWPQAEADAVSALEASGLVVNFGSRKILDEVDIQLRRREVVAVLGESGAGKTTLLRVLAGYRKPDRGVVESSGHASAIQLVSQDAYGSLTPRRRLRDLLAEASAPGFDAVEGAASVQLPGHLLQCTAAEMSGGERRRAALLRAVAVEPDVLLLDEPTASLDRPAAVAVIDNLLKLKEKCDLGLLVATHDEGLAAAIAHRQLRIREGKLCED
jgi:peptide/nickel transport system ATP-binding protein